MPPALQPKEKNQPFKRPISCLKDAFPMVIISKPKGFAANKEIPRGKLFGFRKFDKVQYKGEEYFVKGRMSTGYAILMDTEGNKVDLKPIPKVF